MEISRVAVLSDVHGVLPALESVLAEPEVAAADRIVLTGDLAAGPQPRETLDLLASLGDRALWIRGNADRELVQLARGEVDTVPDPIAPWAAAQLRADQAGLLAGLPLTATLEVTGLGPVLFCHATPRDDEEVVVADSRLERWADVLGSVGPEVAAVVCGHTHMPFCLASPRAAGGQPGQRRDAVRPARAHWALLGPGIQLRRTVFDAGAACARIAAQSSYPDAAEWADFYLNARATDAEALAVMAPRDGRPA